MINAGIIVSLVILFYFLGKSADFVILSVKKIGHQFGIKIFFLGLILGFFTSLPELIIGINALVNNIQAISLGNLMGGIIVLLGLILGASLIAERKIATDGKISRFLPLLIYLVLPFLFSLDSKLSGIDGVILLAAYVFLIQRLYHQNRNSEKVVLRLSKSQIFKEFSSMFLGIIALAVFANVIIRLTLILLGDFNVSIFAVGAALFAIGTNLPETIVVFRSWRRNLKELSMSSLLGSALANPAIIGVFALVKPIYLKTDLSYFLLMTFTLVLLGFLLFFYETGKKLTRREGVLLVSIYFLFLLTQILFLVYLK